MSQLPMYPPQQHEVVGPDGQGTPTGKITRPWLAYLQSLTTNVVNSVTHTGALVLNRLVVGNGGNDIRTEALTDGQIPIGATADGTVQPATITGTLPVVVTNSPHGIAISAPTATTGAAGANTDIQYNDAGAFGGDAHLTWDKTKQQVKVLSTAGLQDSAVTVAETGGGGHISLTPVDSTTAEIELGMVVSGGNYIPDSPSAAYLALLGSSDELFVELDSNLSPPTPVPFTAGVGWAMTGPNGTIPAALEVYQYGGLGTGPVPGMAIIADRNDSGSGATGMLGGQLKDGRFFGIWMDATGAMRYNVGASLAAIRPTEDNSVSDTSGSLFGVGLSAAQVAARVAVGV